VRTAARRGVSGVVIHLRVACLAVVAVAPLVAAGDATLPKPAAARGLDWPWQCKNALRRARDRLLEIDEEFRRDLFVTEAGWQEPQLEHRGQPDDLSTWVSTELVVPRWHPSPRSWVVTLARSAEKDHVWHDVPATPSTEKHVTVIYKGLAVALWVKHPAAAARDRFTKVFLPALDECLRLWR
jgi:hypothetical protein